MSISWRIQLTSQQVSSLNDRKFNPARLEILNNPQRLLDIPPDFIWDRLNMQPPPSAIFIEIGAGTGFFSTRFAKRTNGGRVYACDISKTMVDWMKKNITIPDVIPILMEENRIPLEDGIADLVYTINLHHELSEPVTALKEANRLLKTRGRIFVADWKKEDMTRGPRLEIRYTSQKVMDQLTEAGFRNAEAHQGMPFQFLVTAEK
jgi:ubiquinone/menaquinone biosynthesis C-methylase UbiE